MGRIAGINIPRINMQKLVLPYTVLVVAARAKFAMRLVSNTPKGKRLNRCRARRYSWAISSVYNRG